MKIGFLAPPWVPVPPPAYGGTEEVIDVLARHMAARGHEVKLFATGDSTCPVPTEYLYPRAVRPINHWPSLRRHLRAGYEALGDCDVIHDNTLQGPARHQPKGNIVATMHGPITAREVRMIRGYRPGTGLVAISRSQRYASGWLNWTATIHHGIEVSKYPMGAGGDYLLFLGRMDAVKGVHRAIVVAREAGLPLIIAAKMREPGEREYFEREVHPYLGQDIHYVGEADHELRQELLVSARALINPIQWNEPFGLVMIEAMACGTPVIGSNRGSIPEIVAPGVTGFVCATTSQAVQAVWDVDSIDRADCRRHVEQNFSAEAMAQAYEEVFTSMRPVQESIPLPRRSGELTSEPAIDLREQVDASQDRLLTQPLSRLR